MCDIVTNCDCSGVDETLVVVVREVCESLDLAHVGLLHTWPERKVCQRPCSQL